MMKMAKCKCGNNTGHVWNIDGTLYCKLCHPITTRVISLLDGKAVNRSRLPKDLHEYFSGDYVTPALLSDERVCTKCRQKARYYIWRSCSACPFPL